MNKPLLDIVITSNDDILREVKRALELDANAELPLEWLSQLFRQSVSWHVTGFYAQQRQISRLMVKYRPEAFEAWHLLGFHAQMEGNFEEAEDCYGKALSLRPDFAFSLLAHSQIKMMQTQFHEGTKGYEARFNAITEGSGQDWRGLPFARWEGQLLKDKHIYLWAEQGVGDIAMFASFLPYMIAQGASRIVLGMFPKLMLLFQRSFPQITLEPIEAAGEHALIPAALSSFAQIEQLMQSGGVSLQVEHFRRAYNYATQFGVFDYAAPMGDMLVYYASQIIPAQRQALHLVADAKRVAEIKMRLAELGPGRKVGISWHTRNIREVNRNIPLDQWLPLLATEGCHFISLQHDALADEIEEFCRNEKCNIHVEKDIDITQDAEGLVALIASMDEVITIDNSNAHLAGALGVPTSLLLPKGHNFRWPPFDKGTLWYKSVEVLRQENAGDWNFVLEEVRAQLIARVQDG
jgi:hypothetical protein